LSIKEQETRLTLHEGDKDDDDDDDSDDVKFRIPFPWGEILGSTVVCYFGGQSRVYRVEEGFAGY